MSTRINLADLFRQRALAQPDHPCIIGPQEGEVSSYAELWQQVENAAATLTGAGIRARDCVGLHVPSGRDYIIWTYAAWLCDAVLVPIAVELTPREKQRICREIAIDWVVTDPAAINILPSRHHKDETLGTDLHAYAVTPGKTHPPEFLEINTAFLRFTSGTTGTAKGVILSHETIHARIRAANEVLKIGPEDCVVWLLSMSYHFAVSIVAYLTYGATILLCPSHFGSGIIQAASRHRSTFIYGAPMHYNMMAADTSGTMLPDIRLAISTTTALDGDTARAFERRFGICPGQAYGIIEIGLPCINWEPTSDSCGSVGHVLPAYRLAFEDVGNGEKMQRISFSGPGIFDGYYDPWTPREKVMKDGGFVTGDLGYLDENRFLYISGRAKEMMSVAGMKFFPGEVEEALCLHPTIAEACVVAHPDTRFGDLPYAYMTCKGKPPPTDNELRSFCREHLAPYKIPQKFIYVSELARTASGKLIRKEDAQQAMIGKGTAS